MDLYVVPGGFARSFGDRIALKSLYENYEVNYISREITLEKNSPLLLSAEACLWNDTNVCASLEDLFDRLREQIMLISEKAWYGTNSEGASAEEFMQRVDKFKNRAPLANPSHFVIGTDGNKVAEYDFNLQNDGKIRDKLGLYDGTLHSLKVKENSLILDGNGYFSLPFDTLGYPYTVSFDFLYEDGENAALFDNGRCSLIINHNGTGKMAYNRDLQTYSFDFVFEKGKSYEITLSCDLSDTYLYVNGKLSGKGAIYKMHTLDQNTKFAKFTTFPFPTKYIGKGLVGRISSLKLSNSTLPAPVNLETTDG